MSGAIKVPEGRVTGRLDTVEMVLILFILCLWAFVIRIFLNKWGESMSGLAKSKYFMPGGYYVLSFIIFFFPVLLNQLYFCINFRTLTMVGDGRFNRVS